MALTDGKAIFLALQIAIDTEESLIDSYSYYGKIDETEPSVIGARKNIAAFNRVLSRYFKGRELKKNKLEDGKVISLWDMLAEFQKEDK
jgi:hypothetical protein